MARWTEKLRNRKRWTKVEKGMAQEERVEERKGLRKKESRREKMMIILNQVLNGLKYFYCIPNLQK